MAYSKRSVTFNIFVSMITVSAVFVILFSIIWINNQYQEYNIEIKKLRDEFMRGRKEMLSYVVNEAVDYIAFQRLQTAESLRESLKLRVDEAHELAAGIYKEHYGKIPDKEIEKKIIDTLRMMKYNKGRGYYFIVDFEGKTLLNAADSKLDGVNVINLKDSKGKFFIKEMIDIVRKSGEGFVNYFWPKPAESTGHFPKMSFVREFKPLKFFIGSGEYLKNVEKDIQQASIKRLIQSRFDNGRGYIFASTMDGDPLFTNGEITQGGPNILDLTDPDGIKIIQEQQKAAQKPNGGFVSYSWRKLGDSKISPKLSFVRQVAEWQWMIGAGIYIDDFNEIIETQHKNMEQKVLHNIINFILYLLLLILLSYLMTRYFARRIDFSFKRFIKFFENASDNSAAIDTNELYFSEFVQLAESANCMIADRKQAEENSKTSSAALHSTEEKFKTIVESLHECVWETNLDGEITYISPRIKEILGYAPKEILLKPINKYILKSDRKKLIREFRRSMQNKTPFSHIAISFLTKNDHKVLLESNGAPILDAEKNVIGFRGASRDITEQKKITEYLRQSEKMETLGQLAGGIAHDFNNQLTGIIGYAELLKTRPLDQERFEKYLSVILKASGRASDLTQKLLAFARKGKHLSEPVDMHHILSEVISILERSIDKSIVLTKDFKAVSATTIGDPSQLQNMLLNIALNSRDAITSQGEIIFATTTVTLNNEDCRQNPFLSPGKYVCIKITDNGSGMDNETMKHIFEPFFTTKEKGGTGMGLAAVYGTIQNHNGHIEVESSPGKGTLFSLFLPIIDSKIKHAELVKKEEKPVKNTSILIVDDEAVICDMASEILSNIGYNIHTAANGKEAMNLYSKAWQSIDLVLLDMIMPEMDGQETYAAMRKINPNIRVILWSGFNLDGKAQEIINAGVNKFLHKPFQRNELISAIKEVLIKK